MKKLMVAACAVAFAAAAQAAYVTWGSSVINALPAETGYSLGGGEVTMHLFESATAYNINTLWADYKAGNLGAEVNSGKDDMMYTFMQGIDLEGGKGWTENQDTVYAAAIFTYTDQSGTEWYMVNTAAALPSEAGADWKELGNTIGGQSGSTPTVWQSDAVPEPTSGLLLLLGVAGLALRRRRA